MKYEKKKNIFRINHFRIRVDWGFINAYHGSSSPARSRGSSKKPHPNSEKTVDFNQSNHNAND
jgi:hypothetical protein